MWIGPLSRLNVLISPDEKKQALLFFFGFFQSTHFSQSAVIAAFRQNLRINLATFLSSKKGDLEEGARRRTARS